MTTRKKEFSFIEENAIDSPVKDIQWHGKEVETGGNILQDTGKGKPIILRCFDFAINPATPLPSESEIIDTYTKYIDNFLWKDSLTRIQDLKLVIEKDKFKIFATCQPKTGAVLLEKPLTIQEYASK